MNDSLRLIQDSLRISQLQNRLDSISKITNENLINSKYFDCTISFHLGIFLFILGLITLISITGVKKYLDYKHSETVKEIEQYKEKIDGKIEKISSDLSIELSNLNNKTTYSDYEIKRTMYVVITDLKVYSVAFAWALKVINLSVTFNIYLNELSNFVEYAQSDLDNAVRIEANDNEPFLEEVYLEMTGHLNNLIAFNNGEYAEAAKQMKIKIGKLYHDKNYSNQV